MATDFIQHPGQPAISSVILAELYSEASRHSQAKRLLTAIANLLQEARVVDFDAVCAEKFGQIRGTLLQQGISIPTADLMIASAALVHNLTLVTHNTADFRNIRTCGWTTG